MADEQDDRAVSESAGVAILVGLTVLVVASVGVSVLVIDQGDDGVSASFSFNYQSETSMMLVQHAGGDVFPAGDLVVAGPPGEFTWAELGGLNATANVTEGDLVRLSGSGTWGTSVRTTDTIQVFYEPSEGNRTELDAYN